MKANFFKATILALVTIFTISCSKDDDSSSTETGGGSTTTVSYTHLDVYKRQRLLRIFVC